MAVTLSVWVRAKSAESSSLKYFYWGQDKSSDSDVLLNNFISHTRSTAENNSICSYFDVVSFSVKETQHLLPNEKGASFAFWSTRESLQEMLSLLTAVKQQTPNMFK